MLDPTTSSADLTQATEQMAARTREYLAAAEGHDHALTPDWVRDAVRDAVRDTVCDCMQTLRDHHWPPEHTLAHCKRVVAEQCDALGWRCDRERGRWLGEQLVRWLLDCYYAR